MRDKKGEKVRQILITSLSFLRKNIKILTGPIAAISYLAGFGLCAFILVWLISFLRDSMKGADIISVVILLIMLISVAYWGLAATFYLPSLLAKKIRSLF